VHETKRFASWRPLATPAVVLVLAGAAFRIGGKVGSHPEDQKPGKFPSNSFTSAPKTTSSMLVRFSLRQETLTR
jgi:hypothetical protein